MRIALVYNPSSGGYQPVKLQRFAERLRRASHGLSLHDGSSFDAARDAPEADLICIAGGDGSVRDVLTGLPMHEDERTCAIFPSGTINLLAREYGYKDTPDALLTRIACATPRACFAGKANDLLFLCCASVGPDAFAVARVSPAFKQRVGRIAYVWALLGLIARWPRHRLTVTIDGAPHEAEACLVLKGQYYAGPWSLDDQARSSAPGFRVLLMPKARRRDVLRLMLYAISNRRFADADWQFHSADVVAIDADVPLPVQADGDILTHLPAKIVAVPSKVRFL